MTTPEFPRLPIGGALAYALNVLHAYQLRHPPRGEIHPVGHACSTTGRRPGRSSAPLPPSVAGAIRRLTHPPGFAATLPYVTADPDLDAVAAVGKAVAGTVRGIRPPAAIPVSGAGWDSVNLRFNRPGVPLCCSGPECCAAVLPGAPGPLPIYLSPAEDAAHEYPPDGYCLLCIRADAEAINAVVTKIVESSTMQLGSAAVCLPPFQNLQDCPDG